MKKYTIKDFEKFEVIDGIKQCPTGDYSNFDSFAEGCSFAERCSFGEWCSFAEGCSFAERCSFGKWCSFAEGCSFAERCSFGEWCSFAEGCSFGERCSFAERCSFGEWCSFEEIGEAMNYKKPFFKIGGLGSRPGSELYIWNLKKGVFIRAGCTLYTPDGFKDAVNELYGENHLYHKAVELALESFITAITHP